MSYLWKEFNIKTFRAETIVYRDGVFCPELSTLDNGPIDIKRPLPVHVIYVGEIHGNKILNIDIRANNQPVFLSVRLKNNFPAFLNIFVKNTGKNSELRGHVLLENAGVLKFDCRAEHGAPNTGILIKTNLLAGKNSKSELSGGAVILPGATDTVSDISMTAMCEEGARVQFMPTQHISSVPKSAGHSAAIYQPSNHQVQYLRMGGLGTSEVQNTLREAFRNDFTLF